MNRFRLLCTSLGIAVGGAACGGSSDPAHPAELTGRWVRLREDSTWGDTMHFTAEGALRGSVGYSVPPNLHWQVKRDGSTGPQFCAEVAGEGFCRTYRLSDGRLELIGGPRGITVFRRVP